VWRDPFVPLRAPKVFHLRRDPFERADTDSNSYNVWWDHKVMPVIGMSRGAVQKFVASLQAFPPRQRPASFNVDQILEALYEPAK
jgi:arylsulfatase